MKKIIIIFSIFVFCNILQAQYKYNIQPTNGPYGGYVWSFCYDSTNKSLFANADHIYKLNFATNQWEKQFTDLDSNKDYYFSIVYADSIYLLDYTIGNSDNVGVSGIFRSSDKGVSWKDINYSNDRFSNIIKLSNNYLIGTDWQVSRSSDYGETWTKCINGIDSSALATQNFSQVEYINDGVNDNLFVLLDRAGVYRSINNGDSWERVFGDSIKPNTSYRSYSAMTKTIDKKLFVACDTGIFVSTDYGNTWIKTISGLEKFYYFDMDYLKSDFVGDVYAGSYGIGIIRLKHDSSKWEFINNGLVPLSTSDLFFNNSNNEILTATDGGVYKSTNQGTSWFFYNDGIKVPLVVNTIACLKNNGIFAGTERNGIYFSSNKGFSWNVVNNGINDANITKIKIDSKDNIYAGSNHGRIYKSTNYGLSWNTLPLKFSEIYDISINSKDYIITSISVSHNYIKDSSYYIIYSDSLVISKDGGINWESTNFPNKYISQITIDKFDNIFVGTDSAIYRSTNDWLSWEMLFKPDSILNPNCFFVTKNNTIYLGTNKSIFRSTDVGNSWKNLSDISGITCIISPDIENKIICGTDGNGYFVSLDSGNTWTNYYFPSSGTFVEQREFNDLAFDSYDGLGSMYAATYCGVYRWDDILSVRNINIELEDIIISPNPADNYFDIRINNNIEKIEYTSIHDFLGNEIRKFSNINPDENSFMIDCSDFTSGLYFCKINFGLKNKLLKFIKN